MRRMLLALTGLGLALAVSASAGVRIPSPAPAAVTATTFLVSGRGWGHGVGMSQYGALGYAQDGWTYDQILGHFYTGAELGPVAGRRRAGPPRRGQGKRDRPILGAVPRARRLREDVRPAGRRRPARAEAAGRDQRDADRARGPDPLPAGHGAARARPALPRPDRSLGEGPEAGRGQRPRSRGLPAGCRRAGDAERVAGRGAEGTGRRRALLRARAPAEREGLRPLRRRAQPGLRRDRGRECSYDGRGPGHKGASAALGGQADRRALPLDLGRHDARRGGGLRHARALPRRGRRPSQRALSCPSLGAGRGGGGGPAQGPQVPGAGDLAPADARAVRTCVDRAGDDAGGNDEGQRRGVPACRRPALDLDHAARDDVAHAPRGAGPLRQDGGSERPRERGEGRAAATAGRRRLDEGGRAWAEGEREAAGACQLPDRRRQAGGIDVEGAGRSAADRTAVGAADGGGNCQASGARSARRASARSRGGWSTVGTTTTGVEGEYTLVADQPGRYRARTAPVQGFAEGLSGQIELR